MGRFAVANMASVRHIAAMPRPKQPPGISIRHIEPKLREWLRDKAQEQHMPVAQLARNILRERMEREEVQKTPRLPL